MKSSYIHSPILFSFLLAAGCSPPHVETAQSEAPKSAHLAAMVNPFPDTFADPAVPLLQLPTSFRAKRTSTNISLGVRTHQASSFRDENTGWTYGLNSAVLLGLTDDAVPMLLSRATTSSAPGYRFAGFAPHFQVRACGPSMHSKQACSA